jgi:hypothetical protein
MILVEIFYNIISSKIKNWQFTQRLQDSGKEYFPVANSCIRLTSFMLEHIKQSKIPEWEFTPLVVFV